jgi:hypothetical protein
LPRGRKPKNYLNDVNKQTVQEVQKQSNNYQDYIQDIVEGFVSKMFQDGIVKEVKAEDMVKYFANPDQYHEELEKSVQYYYISNGDVFQQFDLAKVLPTLNYKIDVIEKAKSYEKNIAACNRILKKVKHRTLTRDIISQEITAGTLIGMWLGDKKNPYFYIFDDLEHVFPAYRKNGEWVAWFDLEMLKPMKENERQIIYDNLSPYISEGDYKKYEVDPQNDEVRYIELPQEITVVLRTHRTSRNQRLGIPWATQGLLDIAHKKKLKDMEVAIANKVIKSIAILKLGNEKTPDPPKPLKKKVVAGVKQALVANDTTGTPVIAIPEWSDLKFNDVKTDALDPKKYTTINSDINSSLGTGASMKEGDGGNFASGKINFEIFYKKLAVLLEDIETEVYGKLFNMILPTSVAEDYSLVYDKQPPIPLEKKLDILMRLHNMEGFSLKAVIDHLDGIDFVEYVNQSIYEQETQKLQEKIKPYASSFIGNTNPDDTGGRTPNNDPNNENTVKSKTTDGNSTPSTL